MYGKHSNTISVRISILKIWLELACIVSVSTTFYMYGFVLVRFSQYIPTDRRFYCGEFEWKSAWTVPRNNCTVLYLNSIGYLICIGIDAKCDVQIAFSSFDFTRAHHVHVCVCVCAREHFLRISPIFHLEYYISISFRYFICCAMRV